MICSQIYANFHKHWKLPNQDRSRGTRPRLAQGSLKQVHSNEVGLFSLETHLSK